MFTGIIEATGIIEKARATRHDRTLTVHTDPAIVRRVPQGGSVAVDGVCLTAIARARDTLRFELMDATLKRTTLGARRAGERVNLEPATRAHDIVGSHFVSGHVDGVGRVQRVRTVGRTRYVVITMPRHLMQYFVPQGSVAVNGVSLTVVEIGRDWFSVALTSYTQKHTNLGGLKAGAAVNIEVDMFAKYIFKFLNHYGTYQKLSHRRGKV